MITQAPNKSLDVSLLKAEIDACIRYLQTKEEWFFREKMVDRGSNYDPFYIIDIRDTVESTGDTTWDEPLYYVNSSCSIKQLTHEPSIKGYSYWQKVDRSKVEERLNHFLSMYLENIFQPPGYKEDRSGNKTAHKKFYKKRFLYELRWSAKSIVGVGPSMYAAGFAAGALCGQITDHTGTPLVGVIVELISKKHNLLRESIEGGLFWFSKVPEGNYAIRTKDRACEIHILKKEPFGNIKGWLTDEEGYPVESASVNFSAPDGMVFSAKTNDSGKFTTGALPAYPVTDSLLSSYSYTMQIPNFMFSVTKTVHVKDAIIGGKLKDNIGNVFPKGTIVLLKQKGVQLSETATDAKGNFRFLELAGGQYELEVPGEKIYLSKSSPGKIEGKALDRNIKKTRIELIAEGKVVATERLSDNKEFSFEDVAPGGYEVKKGEGLQW